MATNKSRFTYIRPKNNFEMISASIIEKFDVETVGIYCKMVRLSLGKSICISFLSKTIGINERRMRKVIVGLEEEGYITRKPLHDERGKIYAWNYELYAEPIKKDKRTQAGKPTLHENHQGGKPTKMENGQGIISNNDIIYNNTNNSTINSPVYNKEEKSLSNDKQKGWKTDSEFLKFWVLYDYKKGADTAYRAWKKLSKQEKQDAVKAIPLYFEDCREHSRNKRYPATYLNAHTWEDDFTSTGLVEENQEKKSDEAEGIQLPEGLTPEKWEAITKWLACNAPSVLRFITPEQYLMIAKSEGNDAQAICKFFKYYEKEHGNE